MRAELEAEVERARQSLRGELVPYRRGEVLPVSRRIPVRRDDAGPDGSGRGAGDA